MHVVSRDLEKAKTKKHYLSFADPGFFLDVGWVCSELRARGRVAYDVADKERILKGTGVEDWKGERARRGRGVEEGGGANERTSERASERASEQTRMRQRVIAMSMYS